MDDHLNLKAFDEKCDFTTVDDAAPLFQKNDANEPVENVTNQKYSKSELLIIFSGAILYFIGGVITSMIAAFFPQVAKKKNISSSLNGLIFGVFPLVVALTSPVCGKLIPMLGIKTVLYFGILVQGICMLLYGIVASMYSGSTFIVLSFLYRIVAAIGVTASQNSCLLLICLMFKERISTMFSVLEASNSIGLMIGPVIGGGFYKLGGFVTPFMFAGGINIILLIVLISFMPSVKNLEDGKKEEDDSISVLRVTLVPRVFITCTVVTVFGIAIGFLEPTIAIHLKNITLPNPMNTVEVGLIFLLVTCVYGLVSPIVGYLSDAKFESTFLIVIGLIVCSISYLFLGPTPLFWPAIKPKLWIVCISMIFLGASFAFGVIPTISEMKEAMLAAGIPENEMSLSVLTSVFNCFLNIGYVIGPVAGGYIVQYSSFSWAATVISFTLNAETVLLLAFLVFQRTR